MQRISHCVALLCFVFGAPTICFCQIRIPLQDVSDGGCPIRVSGHVSFQDDPSQLSRYTYGIEGSIENVSGEGVVLTVIHIQTRGVNRHGLDGNRSSDDHFFGPRDLQPGEVENIPATTVGFNEPATDGRMIGHEEANWELAREDVGPEQTPLATAKVTFVQFADGSTWGDTAAGHNLLVYRREILTELRKYERVLDKEGASTFLNAYANRRTYLWFPLLYVLVTKCKGKSDSCLIDGMHSMVQGARQHQAEMKQNWTVGATGRDQPR
jgi:hypothetical protein